MAKILHTADLHLGASVVTLPDDKRRIRKAEQRNVLERLISVARENLVELILIAGDLFEGDNISPDMLDFVVETFRHAQDLQFVISPGNHDPYFAGSPYAMREWPSNVHVFTSAEMSYIEFKELNTRVYGAAFVTHHCNQPIMEEFVCEPYDGCNIVVIHGNYKVANSAYNSISTDSIANCGADYVALGHIHLRSDIEHQPGSRTSIAYCGTPEGHGFDDCGEKGVYIGTVQKEMVRMDFVPTCVRRFERVTAVASTEMKEADIYNLLVNAGEYGVNDIIRLELTGELSDEVNEKKNAIFEDVLESILKKCFWVKLVDSSTVVFERDANNGGYAEFSLISLFQSKINESLEKAQAEKRYEDVKKIKRAYELGMRSLEGREIDL